MSTAYWHSRGYLPHFHEDGATQALTFRLADSLPRKLVVRKLEGLSPEEKARHYQRIEDMLDSGRGSCWLRQPQIAELMQESLLHFDGQRYKLLAWVVMPNHVHVVIETLPGYTAGKVAGGWKGFVATMANRLLDRTGQFWQPETFDRKIRDEQHLHNAIRYIEYNPVRARLCSSEIVWPYSSASFRSAVAANR